MRPRRDNDFRESEGNQQRKRKGRMGDDVEHADEPREESVGIPLDIASGMRQRAGGGDGFPAVRTFVQSESLEESRPSTGVTE